MSMRALVLVVLATLGCGQLPQPEPTAAPLPTSELLPEPAVSQEAAEVTIAPAPETCAGYVALTFDDGPTELTGLLLAELDRAGVPAAFFNRGNNMTVYPGHVEAQAAAGHQVGNHTYSHPDLLQQSATGIANQLARANQVQTDIIGVPAQLFRPPYGYTDPAVRAAALDQGMVEVLWTTDSKDYLATTSQQVLERSTGMEDGDILLLHEGKPRTIEALPHIVNHYHERGLCFGRVDTTEEALPTDLGIAHYARAVAP